MWAPGSRSPISTLREPFCPQNLCVATRILAWGVSFGGVGGRYRDLVRAIRELLQKSALLLMGMNAWVGGHNPELDRKAIPLTREYGDSCQVWHPGLGKYRQIRSAQGIKNPLRLCINLSNLMINLRRAVLNRVDCNHQCNYHPVFPTHIPSISGFCLSRGFRVPELPGA